MADLGSLVAALAALVVPLVVAYLLAGSTDHSRRQSKPKTENGLHSADKPRIQD